MRIPAIATAKLAAALGLAAALAAAPLGAGEPAGSPAEPPAAPEKPLSEQIEEVLRGLVEQVEPTLEQLRDTFRVLERVDSLEHYQKPEILPNGDIIIRRKPDAPPYRPGPEEAPAGTPGPGTRT